MFVKFDGRSFSYAVCGSGYDDDFVFEELFVFTKERGSKGVWRDDVRWVRISVTFVWDGGELCNRITQGSEIYL